jgi:hypothetical protein
MKAKRKERVAGVSVKRTAPLTKAEMIASIQLREAAMFLELKKSEQEYGSEDHLTNMLRSQWSAVNTMMKSLGIPEDNMLPDNREATAIICERIDKLQAS